MIAVEQARAHLEHLGLAQSVGCPADAVATRTVRQAMSDVHDINGDVPVARLQAPALSDADERSGARIRRHGLGSTVL